MLAVDHACSPQVTDAAQDRATPPGCAHRWAACATLPHASKPPSSGTSPASSLEAVGATRLRRPSPSSPFELRAALGVGRRHRHVRVSPRRILSGCPSRPRHRPPRPADAGSAGRVSCAEEPAAELAALHQASRPWLGELGFGVGGDHAGAELGRPPRAPAERADDHIARPSGAWSCCCTVDSSVRWRWRSRTGRCCRSARPPS